MSEIGSVLKWLNHESRKVIESKSQDFEVAAV